jgi:HR-like lesion-inducing
LSSLLLRSFIFFIVFNIYELKLLSRYLEFGEDGGPAVQALRPKYHVFTNHVMIHTGIKLPEVEVRSFYLYKFVLLPTNSPMVNYVWLVFVPERLGKQIHLCKANIRLRGDW